MRKLTCPKIWKFKINLQLIKTIDTNYSKDQDLKP